MEWAEFSEELRAGVLVNIGVDYNVHYRRLAMTTDAEIDEVVASTRVGEGQRPCTLGEKGQVRLFFNGVKTAGGTLPQQASAPTPPIVVTAPAETELTPASANAVALNGTVTTVGNKVARRISVA